MVPGVPVPGHPRPGGKEIEARELIAGGVDSPSLQTALKPRGKRLVLERWLKRTVGQRTSNVPGLSIPTLPSTQLDLAGVPGLSEKPLASPQYLAPTGSKVTCADSKNHVYIEWFATEIHATGIRVVQTANVCYTLCDTFEALLSAKEEVSKKHVCSSPTDWHLLSFSKSRKRIQASMLEQPSMKVQQNKSSQNLYLNLEIRNHILCKVRRHAKWNSVNPTWEINTRKQLISMRPSLSEYMAQKCPSFMPLKWSSCVGGSTGVGYSWLRHRSTIWHCLQCMSTCAAANQSENYH